MRFVSLRPNSPCWPHSRTPSLWVSPVSLGQPVLVAGLLLQFRAHLWLLQLRQHPQRLLRRPRLVMRWRPLWCVPRHSGPPLPGRALALAHLRLCRNALHGRHVAAPVLLLVCVARGVGTGHGLGHQELPTSPASPTASLTCCSCPPRCFDRVSAPRCRSWVLRSHRSCPRGPSCHGAFVQL